MNQNIIYSATTKADVLRRAPKCVLQLAVELKCDLCGAAVLAVRDTFQKAQRSGRATNRQVVVVCEACFPKATAGDELLIAYHHDDDVHQQMTQHEIEKN